MKQKVKAKITRVVTEIATVVLDRDGNIEEIVDIHDEQSSENEEVQTVITVINEW